MADPLVSTTRLRSLRSALGDGRRPVIIAIHDYPDPDAIAAALAMQTLAGSWGVSAVIAHGGVLGREENTEMVRILKIDLKTFSSIPNLDDFHGAVFLDTQPLARNQSLPAGIPVLGVIDHHSLGEGSVRRQSARSATGTTKVVFADVRTSVGASSTLLYGYLRAAGITPDARLATALFLGIKTDTDGLLRDSSPEDVEAYTMLLPLADLKLAALASHPPLDRDYYRFLHMALEKSVTYGGTLLSFCGEVRAPDMLSTASDILIPLKGVNYALAVGTHSGRAYLSLRAKPPRADATRVLLRVVEPEGKGGGHSLSAGGFIDMAGDAAKWPAVILSRLLEATGDAENAKEDLIQ